MNFYYTDETGNVAGPITREQLQALVDRGFIPPDSQACPEGSEDWRLISTFVRPTPQPKTNSPVRLFTTVLIAIVVGGGSLMFAWRHFFSPATPTTSPIITQQPLPSQNQSPKHAELSENAKRDLQDIFIAGDRLLAIAGEIVEARKVVEYDETILDIRLNHHQDTESAFATRDADRKNFTDALARYIEVQVTAKTKIDFLNLPNSPAIKSSMQEASTVWAQFRSTAEGITGDLKKVAEKLKSQKDSSAALFEKAKAAASELLKSSQ